MYVTQMNTMCVNTAAQLVHHTLCCFCVTKTLPSGLSGHCAPFSNSGCNWSRRISVTLFMNLAATLNLEAICCSEAQAAMYKTAQNVGIILCLSQPI
jgi:hypothetical protein